MKNYFMSYVIKQKKAEGGFIDSGYGQTTASASTAADPGEVMQRMLTSISNHFGVEEKKIHVLQFNSL